MHASAGKDALRGGIDLGGTKIQAAIVSPGRRRSAARRGGRRRPRAGPRTSPTRWRRRWSRRPTRPGVQTDSLAGVGVGSPGDTERGDRRRRRGAQPARLGGQLPARRDARRGARRRRCGSATTSTSPPTPSSSSAPASRYDSILGVFWGTGVGGGLILDGKRWIGRGAAGEIGHMVVKRGGARCPCGRRGLHGGLRGARGDGGEGAPRARRRGEDEAVQDHGGARPRPAHERDLGAGARPRRRARREADRPGAARRSAPGSPRRSTCSTSRR